MIRPTLAWLLARANAHPFAARDEFYALKDRLLNSYGQRVGEDIQRIENECWGYPWADGCEGKTCRRCGGTGTYETKRILLERWELAGHVFHRPVGRVYDDRPVTIEGRIRHDWVSEKTSTEARLWLALLFDRALWWRLLTSSRYHGWQWRPMCALQIVAFDLRSFANRWGLGRSRCYACGGRVIRPFDRGHWSICRSCQRAQAAAHEALWARVNDDELPF